MAVPDRADHMPITQSETARGMSRGPRPDLTISIERPGSRRMRGLAGPDDRRGRGRHRGRRRASAAGPGRLQSRRGAIRDATLALLAEQPMHGYQVMQELAERSGGRWHPSAGSVYPTLQQLEDEGLVTVEDRDGRRTFALTDAGRTAAAAIPAERPWSRSTCGDDLRGLVRELGVAASRSPGSARPRGPSEARTVLTEARRALYRLLADDDAAARPRPDRLGRRAVARRRIARPGPTAASQPPRDAPLPLTRPRPPDRAARGVPPCPSTAIRPRP